MPCRELSPALAWLSPPLAHPLPQGERGSVRCKRFNQKGSCPKPPSAAALQEMLHAKNSIHRSVAVYDRDDERLSRSWRLALFDLGAFLGALYCQRDYRFLQLARGPDATQRTARWDLDC